MQLSSTQSIPATPKVLITGGTGFFGCSLLRTLDTLRSDQLHDFALTILSRKQSKIKYLQSKPWYSSDFDYLCGDVLDLSSLPWSHSFTHIIHAATSSYPDDPLNPFERLDTIIQGTRNIVEYARLTGVQRLLFTSSGDVYEPPSVMRSLAEDDLIRTNVSSGSSTYALSKIIAEHILHVAQRTYDLDIVIARCFAFLGPDLPTHRHFAIGNFISDALTQPRIIVRSDGSSVRSYMSHADLSKWLISLLFKGQPSQTYNVGSDKAISIAELAYLVRNTLSPHKQVVFIPGTSSTPDSRPYYVPSVAKACQHIPNLTQDHNLESLILAIASSMHCP